jgi:transposase-like protein
MTEECVACGTGVDSPEELMDMLADDCPECDSEDVEKVGGFQKCQDCGHTF